jgi:hypothetical protein
MIIVSGAMSCVSLLSLLSLLDNYSYCNILLTQFPSGSRKTSCNSQLLEPIYTSSTQQVVSVLLHLLVLWGLVGLKVPVIYFKDLEHSFLPVGTFLQASE